MGEVPLWMKVTEVIILGGLGLIWKVLAGMRKESREKQTLLLASLEHERQIIKDEWERAFSKLRPALELQSKIAWEVAEKYYRPLLDAVVMVDIYAEVYDVTEELVRAAHSLKEHGRLPADVRANVRQYFEFNLNEDPQATENARQNCAKYLSSELKNLATAVDAFKKSGYMSELVEIVGIDYLKDLLNLYHAAEIWEWVDNPTPAKVSEFLASWRARELAHLRMLKDRVPWTAFLTHYLRKLTGALQLAETGGSALRPQ